MSRVHYQPGPFFNGSEPDGILTFRLVEQYDVSFVSTGDVLRKEIMAKSEVGLKAEAVVARGGRSLQRLSQSKLSSGLVSDELMLEIVKAELDRLRGKVSSLFSASIVDTKRAGLLMVSHVRCTRANFSIPS